MTLLSTRSTRLDLDLDHLLASTEDPVLTIREVIRDMDEAIDELRRETLDAVLRQKDLERRARLAEDRAAELERKAGSALEQGDRQLARRLLGERVDILSLRDRLTEELGLATILARRVKTDLRRMQARVDAARHRKEALIRPRREPKP